MEIIFSFILVAILIGLFISSLGFGGIVISTDKIGPGGFPQIIIIICLFLMALVIWDNIKNKNKKEEDLTRKGTKILVLNIVLLGIYIFLLNIAGFFVSTILFGLAAIRNMGYRSLGRSFVFILILTVLVVLVFGRVFYVSLPRGISFFRMFSYYLY